MQRPIKPEWLLRQANELAGRTARPGQPRNADLRRAVSAAYYALFHAIVQECTQALLGLGTDQEQRSYSRLFGHSKVKAVCDWITGNAKPGAYHVPTITACKLDADLLDVATAFTALQQERHDADYNHLASFNRPATLSLIDQAQDAVEKLRGLPPVTKQRFVTAVVMNA